MSMTDEEKKLVREKSNYWSPFHWGNIYGFS